MNIYKRRGSETKRPNKRQQKEVEQDETIPTTELVYLIGYLISERSIYRLVMGSLTYTFLR